MESLEKDKESDNQSDNKPWLWKKGQSGNPKGRPKGKTAKERAKEYLATMTDDEFENFLAGMNKKDVWEMAEGRPAQDMNLEAKSPIFIIAKEIAEKNDITPQPEQDSTGQT